jgi:hypothetical protein
VELPGLAQHLTQGVDAVRKEDLLQLEMTLILLVEPAQVSSNPGGRQQLALGESGGVPERAIVVAHVPQFGPEIAGPIFMGPDDFQRLGDVFDGLPQLGGSTRLHGRVARPEEEKDSRFVPHRCGLAQLPLREQKGKASAGERNCGRSTPPPWGVWRQDRSVRRGS